MSTLREWATQLAQELPGWDHQPSKKSEYGPNHTYLVHSETGASILVKTDSWDVYLDTEISDTARLEFSACWPRAQNVYFNPRDEDSYKITCAASRTLASIAQGLHRRLIDKYLPVWLEQNLKLTQHLEHLDATYQAAQAIAETLGVQLSDEQQGSDNIRIYIPGLHRHGYFEVRGPDLVKIECHGLSGDVAIEVARILCAKNLTG